MSSIYEIIHIWTAVVDKSEEWSSQWFSNLSNWKEEEITTTWYYVNSRRNVDSEKIRVPDGIWTHYPPWSRKRKKKPEKIRASTGFEPVTSAISVRCSTNWAMKPHSWTIKANYHSMHFFFLSIDREPTTWPANYCLQIMVCSCLVPSKRVLLQMIFCSCAIDRNWHHVLERKMADRSPELPGSVWNVKTILVIE